MIINKNNNLERQAGVSLMLSVLVLSAVTAVSFSLATIIFVELRSSGDVLRSEPAVYATLGVTEEALFQYKRYVNERENPVNNTTILDVPTCYSTQVNPNPNICQIGNVNLTIPNSSLLTYDDTPKVQSVLSQGTVILPLYEINNYAAQYGKVKVELIPTGSVNSLSVQYREIPNSGNSYFVSSQTITESQTGGWTYSIPNTTGSQYELVLTNSTSDNFLVSISSYDTDSTTPKGLPFVGKKALEVGANYLGLTRTYRVYIPVP